MEFSFYRKFDIIPKEEWSILLTKEDIFLSRNFLEIFDHKIDKDFYPIYIVGKINNKVCGVFYAQAFKLSSNKIKDYINHNHPHLHFTHRLKLLLSNLLNFKVCFLGNLFMSNESSAVFTNQFNSQYFQKLIEKVLSFSEAKFVLIPEFYNNFIPYYDKCFQPLMVEPDMQMNIPKQWDDYEDYIDSIQSKYKKRARKIQSKSKSIISKELNSITINDYSHQIKKLFNNVFYKSSFNAIKFDTNIFLDFINRGINLSIYGYFKDDKLVGFSSSLINKSDLYVYFMGLDYRYNITYNLYSKMLLDNIKYAIDNDFKSIRFGRTACEFKSNFGAIPKENLAHVYTNSKILLFILKPLTKLLKPKLSIFRNPFK